MFLPTDITLEPGDSGDYVLEMQRRLAQRNLLSDGNLNATYDGPTTQAVREFQSQNGLVSDGIAGPQTLRRLISIGGAFGESGGGSTDGEEEQDEHKELEDIEIRHDEAQIGMEEQQKLRNEAVWGYGADEQSMDAIRESQLENAPGESQNAPAAAAEKRDVIQESLDQQRLAQHELDNLQQQPEQLTVDQQGIEARTPMDDLAAKPDTGKEAQTNAQAEQYDLKQETAQAKAEQPTVEPKAGFGNLEAQAEQHAPQQSPPEPHTPQQNGAAAEPAVNTPRDPELVRTEAQLDQGSQQHSQEEGQKLHSKGVKDNGKVPESELGEMTPAQTPAVERTREVGLGA